jgi:hypothetical protein
MWNSSLGCDLLTIIIILLLLFMKRWNVAKLVLFRLILFAC